MTGQYFRRSPTGSTAITATQSLEHGQFFIFEFMLPAFDRICFDGSVIDLVFPLFLPAK